MRSSWIQSTICMKSLFRNTHSHTEWFKQRQGWLHICISTDCMSSGDDIIQVNHVTWRNGRHYRWPIVNRNALQLNKSIVIALIFFATFVTSFNDSHDRNFQKQIQCETNGGRSFAIQNSFRKGFEKKSENWIKKNDLNGNISHQHHNITTRI